MHSGRAGFILRVLCGQVRFDRADFVLGLYMQVAFIVFSEATEPTLSVSVAQTRIPRHKKCLQQITIWSMLQ